MSDKFKYILIPEPIVFFEADGTRAKTPGQNIVGFLNEVPFNDRRMGTGHTGVRRALRIEAAFAGAPGTEAKVMQEDYEVIRDSIADCNWPNMLRAKQQSPFLEAWADAKDESRTKPADKPTEEPAK